MDACTRRIHRGVQAETRNVPNIVTKGYMADGRDLLLDTRSMETGKYYGINVGGRNLFGLAGTGILIPGKSRIRKCQK